MRRCVLHRLHWFAIFVALLIAAAPWITANAVGSAAVKLSFESSENPVAAGKGAVLLAKVTGGTIVFTPRPTGTVTFKDSAGTVLCTSSLVALPAENAGQASCTFPASRPAGSYTLFVAYSGDGNYNAAGAPGLVQVVAASYTITANAGAGGTVNPGSYTLVPQNGTVIFDFTPSTGFRIASVTGVAAGCRVISAPLSGNVVRYTISQITANCSLSATFTNLYTVTFAADVGGTVSPSGDQRVVFGSTPTITVTPNRGFRLVNVTGCGVVFNGGAAITGPTTWNTAAIATDCTVTAFFTALPTFTVTAAAGAGGSISPQSVAVPQGLTTQFTVSPASGFQIASVTGCSGTRSGSTYTTRPITAACAVTATFSVAPLPTFVVSAVAGSGGSISPATTNVTQGGSASFTVSPNSGFAIASVSGCGGSLSGNIFNTAAISAACTVSATFAAVSVAPTTTRMIEYRHPPLDYYFITSRPAEIALLDATPPFVRTGQSFLVLTNNAGGAHPITRIYFDKIAVGGTRGSHFYTLVDAELLALVGLNPSNAPVPKLPVSEGVDSFAFLPLVEGIGGSCAAGLIPVYRLFRGNARFPDNPNHRFTSSTAIFNDFVSQGWDGEGVKLCVPG